MGGFREFWDKWKMWIIAALVVAVLIIAAIVLYYVVFRKKKDTFSSFVTESFVGVDDAVYADQYKYAESYINSVLNLNPGAAVATNTNNDGTIVNKADAPDLANKTKGINVGNIDIKATAQQNVPAK